VAWAMRFPTDPEALRLLGAARVGIREREMIIESAYRTGVWDTIRDQVPLRHPSQLYQAATEGLLLLAILWAVFMLARHRKLLLPDGLLGGLFLLCYGLFRSFTEMFRQPDAQFRGPGDPVGTVLGPFTMGQMLSLFMILGGAFLLYRSSIALRARRRAPG
jgi:phosphatidylglycerol---prolipoprotein diacylglyceryl transferase